jgi:hypothetical protein
MLQTLILLLRRAECYLQFKKPNSQKQVTCPFCNSLNYSVKYTGSISKEERQLLEQVFILSPLTIHPTSTLFFLGALKTPQWLFPEHPLRMEFFPVNSHFRWEKMSVGSAHHWQARAELVMVMCCAPGTQEGSRRHGPVLSSQTPLVRTTLPDIA